jgi:hypothetical protein
MTNKFSYELGYLERVHEFAERPNALDTLNESIDWLCLERKGNGI